MNWVPGCVGNSAGTPFLCFAFHYCGQCTTSTGEQKGKTCKMQGRCHDGRLSIIATLEPPLQYNNEGSLPQPDLMERTSESFLQRLLLVVQNVDCLHVPRDMWRRYLMYQSFQTHLLYVSSTTMPPVRPGWASKTTAVNSLMW